MVFTLKGKVTRFCVSTRVLAFVLSAVSNLIISDHDADSFIAPKHPNESNPTLADQIISMLFSGLCRWDAQYFLHIAQYGYIYENSTAFFPLYPFAIRYVGQVLIVFFHPYISVHHCLLLSAIGINFILNIKIALLIFDLTLYLFKDYNLAYRSSILFCINPATIFFVAPYSESLYLFLTLEGIILCLKFQTILASLIFSLASVTRSNGILNFGYIIYYLIFDNTFLTKFGIAITLLVCLFIQYLPFYAFQYFCYQRFCFKSTYVLPKFLTQYALKNNVILPGKGGTWCNDTFPLAYNYVQKHYWNVGFLRYYEFKQIPNFLLATPVLLIVFWNSYKFFKNNYKLRYLRRNNNIRSNKLPYKYGKFPFALHLVILAIFALFCIHVQVSTRLLFSCSPCLYWYCSILAQPSTKRQPDKSIWDSDDSESVSIRYYMVMKTTHNVNEYVHAFDPRHSESWCKVHYMTQNHTILSYIIYKYYEFYFVIGIILFSNFYPWT